jgi:hypothetical protein
MITKFKIYESLNKGKPEIDDYILVKYLYSSDPNYLSELKNFLDNTIGILNDIDINEILVRYDNVPNNLKIFFKKTNKVFYTKPFEKKSIVCYSKNKEDLEKILMANKFNI